MAKRSSESAKVQNLENQLKRALADYANLQKRIEQEKLQIVDFAKAGAIARFLNILDILESVEKEAKKQKDSHLSQGVEIAVKEFKKVLDGEGVKEISAGGEFDPRLHEPVEVVKGEKDSSVIEVLTKGYSLGDKVLRPARVKVSRKES